MPNQQLFNETFSHLHASDDTLQEVMNMTRTHRKPTRTLSRAITLAATLALLLSLAITASATGLLTDIIAKFSNAEDPGKALSDIYGEPAATDAPHAPGFLTLGDCTFSVEGSFAVGQTTVSLKDFAMNGMGIGALTFTVENPEGIAYRLSDGGTVILDGDLKEPRLFVDKDTPLGDNAAETQLRLIQGNEDGTMAELVMYFGLQDCPVGGEPMYLDFSSTDDQVIVEITPPYAEGNLGMEGTDFKHVEFGSQGMALCWQEATPLTLTGLTIHFTDGSTYQVLDQAADVDHTQFYYWRTTTVLKEDGTYGIGVYDRLLILFDRTIDPLRVSHITASYNWTESDGDPVDPQDVTWTASATYHY